GKAPWISPREFFSPSVIAAGLHEKIWYDFRGYYKAEAREALKVRDFDAERVRLAADLNGVSAGDVQPSWFREQRRKNQRWLKIWVAIAVVLAVLAALLVLALRDARIERAKADEQ